MSTWRRLYRIALYALPERLRKKHGQAMEALYLEHLQATGGRAARIAAGLDGLWDVLRRGLYERLAGPSGGGLRGLSQDLRHGLRTLVKSPRFTLVAGLTLALGIGATSAIFTVVDAVVLRPLPFPAGDRVTHLAWERKDNVRGYMTAFQYEYWRDHTRTLERVATYRGTSGLFGEDGRQGRVRGLRVTASFLETLGYAPALGPGISLTDDRPGGRRVMVVSEGMWRDRFGADPGVVGRTAWVAGEAFTIVGVLPADFAFPEDPDYTDFLTALHLDPSPQDAGENYPILARLRVGVSRQAAREDVARVSRQFEAAHPDLVTEGDRGMRLATYQELFVGDLAGTLWVLLAAVGAVLLVAALNVANLMLARASDRREEMAVRAALGASRARIIRQIVSEGVLLAAMAGLGGFLLARWGVDALLALSPERLPRTAGMRPNGTVLAFSGAVTLLAGIGASLGAALAGTRGAGSLELRRAVGNSRGRGRSALLAVEAALSMVLLVGAGLLIGTLRQLRSVDPGFDAAGVVTARLSRLPGSFERSRDVADLVRRVAEGLEGDPAALAVSATSTLPLERGLNLPMAVPGRDDEGRSLEWRAVAPHYPDALGVELLRGRGFTDEDGADAPPVVLVNQTFADQYFPDGDVLGRHVAIGRFRGRYIAPPFDVAPAEIVGVIADVRESSLKRDARATVLVPLAQVPENLASMPVLIVRARDARAAAERIRAVVPQVAPGLPEPDVGSLSEVVAGARAPERFHALLMTTFAIVALALTAFGIYGVVSYRVGRRTREVGIRMALGAGRHGLTWRIVAESMRPVLSGLALGAVVALALARFLGSLVWGISTTDPATIGVVGCVLAAVACVASWLPVRGATGSNPATTLRRD